MSIPAVLGRIESPDPEDVAGPEHGRQLLVGDRRLPRVHVAHQNGHRPEGNLRRQDDDYGKMRGGDAGQEAVQISAEGRQHEAVRAQLAPVRRRQHHVGERLRPQKRRHGSVQVGPEVVPLELEVLRHGGVRRLHGACSCTPANKRSNGATSSDGKP